MVFNQDAEPVIETHELWYTYTGTQSSLPDSARSIEALRGIDLKIWPGEYVALIGANGSGKSTLARNLNGLFVPTRGRVLVNGLDTAQHTHHSQIHRTVQMIFQHPDTQIIANTVEEDVAFGPENFGVPRAELTQRVKEALETVGMWEERAREPHMLSAGQKQRVAIAGALAVRPQVLVLDEATAMLDPSGRIAVLELLRLLHSQGTTIITITHEMDEAAEAERVVVLDNGLVVMDDAPREVFSRSEELRTLGLDTPPLTILSEQLQLPVCLNNEEFLAALPPIKRTVRSEPSVAQSEPQTTRPDEAIIDVRGLDHTYLLGSPLETVALRGVTLSIARGKITGLIGKTGSGKSTLMQHFNGLMRPQAGHVVVDGVDWADPTINIKETRQKVGLLFQQPEDQLFERFVGDDVAYGPRQLKLDAVEVRERVRTAMNLVGLPFEEFKDRLTITLSGGEARRAALAGVLALRPQVLVADEPTAGLDPGGRAEILNVFRRLNQEGVTLIIATHRMEDIALMCESVIALRRGEVAASGSTRQVLCDPEILQRHGLPPLPLVRLVNALREIGWPVPKDALTVIEISDALLSTGAYSIPLPKYPRTGVSR